MSDAEIVSFIWAAWFIQAALVLFLVVFPLVGIIFGLVSDRREAKKWREIAKSLK